MTKLDVVKFLISEMESEIEMTKAYKLEEESARAKAKENGKPYGYWGYMNWKGREPRKSRIIQNSKKIRQLMLDIGREL